jgi:cytochrome c1
LLVASVDKAREMGIDWWEHDPSLSTGQRDLAEENKRLRERIGALEASRHADRDDDGADVSPKAPGRERSRQRDA